MTDKEIIIAIAEIRGWKKEYIHGNGIDDEVWICPKTKKCWLAEDAALPDYLNDLNACAEFEKTLTDKEHNRYRAHIYGMTFNPRECFSATARQRCLAYLKTKGIIP